MQVSELIVTSYSACEGPLEHDNNCMIAARRHDVLVEGESLIQNDIQHLYLLGYRR